MEFLRKFSNKPTPKDVAKDRLKFILIHDRGDLSQETLENIRTEILGVLSKYMEINQEDVEIAVSKSDTLEGASPALIANIPIKNIKNR